MRHIQQIIIHCSATKPSIDIGKKEIDQWHRKRGWKKVGYHYIIRRDGTIEVGRPLLEIGSHARGYNKHSIGICYVGGVDASGRAEDNRTPEQKEALKLLVQDLKSIFKSVEIYGHNELSNKACPCFDVKKEFP